MPAIALVARADLRRRWRSVVVLTLLVGFVGTVVLALAAGARRTSTSLERFEEYSRAATLEISVGDATPTQLREFASSPGVKVFGSLRQLTVVAPDGRFLPVAGALDTAFHREVDRPKVIAGRLANDRRSDEVNIGESLAHDFGVGVGGRIRFRSYGVQQRDQLMSGAVPPPEGPRFALRVVGIVRRPLDLGGRGTRGGVVALTRGFERKYGDQIISFAGRILRVRTVRGDADIPRVTASARRIFGKSPEYSVLNLNIEGKGAQNGIDVTTVAMWLATGVAALAGVAALGIALSREIGLSDVDQGTLRALGMRERDRVVLAATIGFVVALAGVVLAVIGALLASPLFPIGVAGKAEPYPGIRVDTLVLAAGALLVAGGAAALSGLAAWRTARSAAPGRATPSVSLAAQAASQLELAPALGVGMELALDRGDPRRPLPVRSSLAGAAFGVVVIVAVALFAASLDHLASTPRLWGWTWDVGASDSAVSLANANYSCPAIKTRISRVAGVSDVATICTASVDIGGRPLQGWAYLPIRGKIGPTIVEGRAPSATNEVALGAETLDTAGRHIGDHVRVAGSGGRARYRIVGRVVVPGLTDPEPLADAALFTAAGFHRIIAREDSSGEWQLVARFQPGADRRAVLSKLKQLQAREAAMFGPQLPAEIDRIQQIDQLPYEIGGFVAIAATAGIGYALVTAVRRRRRDLAVLKTLGFRRRQVRATVGSQASTVVVVGLLVGIPLGIVVGRFAWQRVADGLGVSNAVSVPALVLLALVPVALILVNLIAAFPARAAARTPPAVVLRSE